MRTHRRDSACVYTSIYIEREIYEVESRFFTDCFGTVFC